MICFDSSGNKWEKCFKFKVINYYIIKWVLSNGKTNLSMSNCSWPIHGIKCRPELIQSNFSESGKSLQEYPITKKSSRWSWSEPWCPRCLDLLPLLELFLSKRSHENEGWSIWLKNGGENWDQRWADKLGNAHGSQQAQCSLEQNIAMFACDSDVKKLLSMWRCMVTKNQTIFYTLDSSHSWLHHQNLNQIDVVFDWMI